MVLASRDRQMIGNIGKIGIREDRKRGYMVFIWRAVEFGIIGKKIPIILIEYMQAIY